MDIDREQAARYGIHVQDIQDLIMTGIGGMNITTTVEGRERYPVRVRYMRELRDNPEALKFEFYIFRSQCVTTIRTENWEECESRERLYSIRLLAHW